MAMNRTEHDLRMAFEPEYESKWRELEEHRDRVHRLVFRTRDWLPVLVASTVYGVIAGLSLGTRWLGFAVPAIVMAVQVGMGLLFVRNEVRRGRKELGID